MAEESSGEGCSTTGPSESVTIMEEMRGAFEPDLEGGVVRYQCHSVAVIFDSHLTPTNKDLAMHLLWSLGQVQCYLSEHLCRKIE